MRLEGILRIEHDVVAALHHARATAFPESALAHQREVERRVAPERVQRGHQPRAAGAEDENVGREPVAHDIGKRATKLQTPKTKHQRNPKHKAPNSGFRTTTGV